MARLLKISFIISFIYQFYNVHWEKFPAAVTMYVCLIFTKSKIPVAVTIIRVMVTAFNFFIGWWAHSYRGSQLLRFNLNIRIDEGCSTVGRKITFSGQHYTVKNQNNGEDD